VRRLITLDISPATATHCGEGGLQNADPCQYASKKDKCKAFGKKPLKYDKDADELMRLPECIAAEQNAAQKGGSQ